MRVPLLSLADPPMTGTCTFQQAVTGEQAFSRSGITQPREHEVDRGPGGIDSSVQVEPTALDMNVGLIDTPGLIGWLEMTAQPRLQFGTVALDPASDSHVVRFQAALAEQFFDIAERERAPQLPAHGAKNQFGLGLAPLEDRRAHRLFHDLFRLPAAACQSCNTTRQSLLQRRGSCRCRPARRTRDGGPGRIQPRAVGIGRGAIPRGGAGRRGGGTRADIQDIVARIVKFVHRVQ